MTRTKRLTETERAEIVREAADGVSTSELAERFGVTARAVRYTLKADADRQRDAAVATAAVTVKLTPEELEALDEVLAAAGIETRTEGFRRLIQAAGGTFVPDARLAAELARYRASLHEVGNGVVLVAGQQNALAECGGVFVDLCEPGLDRCDDTGLSGTRQSLNQDDVAGIDRQINCLDLGISRFASQDL